MAQLLLGDIGEIEIRYWYAACIRIVSDEISISIFHGYCHVVSRVVTPVPVDQAHTEESF